MKTTTPSFDFENQHPPPVVGIDEVGCGPWAGPVVVGAVIFEQPYAIDPSILVNIRDSKALTLIQREKAYNQLVKLESICYSIGVASVEEIDCLNIWQATQLAMKRAISELKIHPISALIDGIRKPASLSCPVRTIVKGDQISYSIAAASIIAKVTRDRIMGELDKDYPAYGWAKNAGYGTAQHHEALRLHGVTLHHRRSYAPIAALLST